MLFAAGTTAATWLIGTAPTKDRKNIVCCPFSTAESSTWLSHQEGFDFVVDSDPRSPLIVKESSPLAGLFCVSH
jgi:hypothetical protein